MYKINSEKTNNTIFSIVAEFWVDFYGITTNNPKRVGRVDRSMDVAVLTNVKVLLKDSEPVPEFKVVEVGLDVGDLDVRLLRVQLARLHHLRVLDHQEVVSAEFVRVEILSGEKIMAEEVLLLFPLS